ncbi:MAG TPA: 4Fe-4S dicluster domain-containing protein, partial [Anaerolineales bacterium]|nr:4Fe-4S dicluster domain-containing protein [Anaerolineales bacterium]
YAASVVSPSDPAASIVEVTETGEGMVNQGCSCETALWPTLSITENCAACGPCARYCPSGALSTRVVGSTFIHFFTPGVCVACGLCAQVCHSGALERSYAPEPDPFEERVMAVRPIKTCRKCGSPALDALNGLCYWMRQ